MASGKAQLGACQAGSSAFVMAHGFFGKGAARDRDGSRGFAPDGRAA